MKRYIWLTLLALIIGKIGALDTESYQFIDHLLGIRSPGEPQPYDDGIIFTAPSHFRSVGIAFGFEGYSKIYWFQKLLSPQNTPPPTDPKAKQELYLDSGILFHAITVPPGVREIEYRLIINGLWTVDPLNNRRRLDPASGMLFSLAEAPNIEVKAASGSDAALGFRFHYQAPPGEVITLAGDFNGWDPFMYQLKETEPGQYSIAFPLPPGIYRYVFYRRGERTLDPFNHQVAYTLSGERVSEITVP